MGKTKNLNTVINEAIAKGAACATRKPVANLRRDVAMPKRESKAVQAGD